MGGVCDSIINQYVIRKYVKQVCLLFFGFFNVLYINLRLLVFVYNVELLVLFEFFLNRYIRFFFDFNILYMFFNVVFKFFLF